MRTHLPARHIIRPYSPFGLGTVAKVLGLDEWDQFRPELLKTTSGYATSAPREEEKHDSGAAILELRRLTGLTWEQLARLFQVARRSVHFWASGKPLNSTNEEQLYRMLSTVRKIDRGSASENRTLLLREHKGQIPFDLLAIGRYDEVVSLVGAGSGRASRKLRPLSHEAQVARAPRPPVELTDAHQDRVHDERGRSQSAAPSRPKREK
jgi:DNA-binding transcriptional regulator YiaG